jgi:hypothetical protein
MIPRFSLIQFRFTSGCPRDVRAADVGAYYYDKHELTYGVCFNVDLQVSAFKDVASLPP